MKKLLIACFACVALSVWAEPAKSPDKKPADSAKAADKKATAGPKAEAKDAKPADKSGSASKGDGSKPSGPPTTK